MSLDTEINNALNVLKKGGLILYPTDTVWGIGCDASNAGAIDRIYKLKKRDDTKAMICLVDGYRMLEQPLVSTSANISGLATPKSFKDISPEILEGVDYVVNLQKGNSGSKPSAIIKLSNSGVVTIVRK